MPSGHPVLLFGAGGHARVCLEALRERSIDVVGAVSSDGTGVAGLGVPMLGTADELDDIATAHGVEHVCVAIGDNATRERIARDLVARGFELATAHSMHATVSRTADVGAGSHLLAGAVVTAATRLGLSTIVNTNGSIDHDGVVGDFVHVAPGVAIGGSVTIGDRAFVGIGARVVPGVTIGADAVVGAGAVVIDDVAPATTVVGVPARPLERG